METKKNSLILIAAGLAVLIIFAIEYQTPLGVTDWLGYLIVLLLVALRLPSRYTLGLTALCSILLWVGFYMSPPGVPPAIAFANRAMGSGAIWIIAFVLVRHKQARDDIIRLNAALQQRAHELEAANKELEGFLYSVSHDLRSPLRAINGFARILTEEYASQLPDKAQRYLCIIQENAHQMGDLIDDLLAFSRLNRQTLKRQPVAPAELARQALESLGSEQDQRQIEIVIADLPRCDADPMLLKQVFVNLLSNALKFTRTCPVARVQVGWLTPSPDQDPVYFVKDNGVGFDMQYIDKLFHVFHRLHQPEEYEGTGVGLALVQRIIQRHGGRVWAEGHVDQGATFYFTLPGKRPTSGEKR